MLDISENVSVITFCGCTETRFNSSVLKWTL